MRGIKWIGAAWLAFLATGCGLDLPTEYPISQYTKKQLVPTDESTEIVAPPGEIVSIVNELFDGPSNPDMVGMSSKEYESVYRGSHLYQRHCIHCHGMAGGGDGPTASFLIPRPRDYRKGVFKWKSTKLTAKPTRDDLLTILKDGAVGTSMPPFRLMSEHDLNDLVSYVIFLSKRGELERRLLLNHISGEDVNPETAKEMLDEINASWQQAGNEVIVPASQASVLESASQLEASVVRGQAIFYNLNKVSCIKCHGEDGQARPESWGEDERKKMVDEWGFPNAPRNLTLGHFRGGRRPIDVYRRVHQGIKGSSMPEFGKNLKPDEIWDLVNFVRAMPYRPDLIKVSKPAPSAHAVAGESASGAKGH